LNSLNDKGAGFGKPTNKVTFITKDFKIVENPLKSKELVAEDIVNLIVKNMRFKFIIVFILSVLGAFSQELKATVVVNSAQVTNVNPQIFKNLEKQIFDF